MALGDPITRCCSALVRRLGARSSAGLLLAIAACLSLGLIVQAAGGLEAAGGLQALAAAPGTAEPEPVVQPADAAGLDPAGTQSEPTDLPWSAGEGRPPSPGHRSPATMTVVSSPETPGWVEVLRREGARAASAGSVSIGQTAPEQVDLGSWLAYTLTITNSGDQDATVLAHDILPLEVPEADVVCTSTVYATCTVDVEVLSVVVNMPTQYGAVPFTSVIRIAQSLTWPDISLPAGQTRTLTFAVRVGARTDNSVLDNRAYIKYDLADGSDAAATARERLTVVDVPVEPGAGAAFSAEPTTLLADYGGSAGLDWGDFDRDGDLDLVLGSSLGTIVYRNLGGVFENFWDSHIYSHDVHWADLAGDDELELIVLGYDWWSGVSHNHLYRLSADGSRFIDFGPTPLTGIKLLEALPADLDADGDLDILALTYRRFAADGCTLRFYPNDSGQFTATHTCLFDPYVQYGRITEDLLSLGDYDNDDDLDMAIDVYRQGNPDPNSPCAYQDALWVLTNDSGVFTHTDPMTVTDFSNCAWPVDLSWGDYDADGYLDLAAAIPVLTGPELNSVRIYRNQGPLAGTRFTETFRFTYPKAPPAFGMAIDWADVDLDGDLDLVVAGPGLKAYLNDSGSFTATRFLTPASATGDVPALDLALADPDGDGDLDAAVASPYGFSPMFSNLASPLRRTLTAIAPWSGGSVAWGDADGDGSQDLLFGASETTVDAEIYFGERGAFSAHGSFPATGFGPHAVAFGDVDNSGELDVALGTIVGIQVYLAGNRTTPNWATSPDLSATSLAWGDGDDDGDLDLLVAGDGPELLYGNTGGQLSTTPAWTGQLLDDTRAVAWADYNGDQHLDFVVGNYDQHSYLYRNNRDHTWTPVWNSEGPAPTTSAAWADYDADGDLDLTLGNRGQANVIYENQAGSLSRTPIWRSEELSQTTSLAWGDWDNDGDLDLAVGNDGEPDQVYINLSSRPGVPRLRWLWRSATAMRTTGVAWGDRDGDGDLDLAASAEGQIGYYENFYVRPSHLNDDFVSSLPLSNQPSYLAVLPPGSAGAAYGYPSAERLSGPQVPTVTIPYLLYDGDGTRHDMGSDLPGDPLRGATFEYSLDGGGTWSLATEAGEPAPVPTVTQRLGWSGVFLWDAAADEAVSDQAVFRMSIVHANRSGPVQHARTSAASPPFRVRGTTCTWPQNPTITVNKTDPALGEKVHFVGAVEQGQGVLTFHWDFGDGTTARWQEGNHAFTYDNRYLVRLTVSSEPCPYVKQVVATVWIGAGSGVAHIHLPLVVRGSDWIEP